MRLPFPGGRPPGVPPIDPPLHEGTVSIGRDRRLGYAMFGDPRGRLVVWFHGTPGGKRQLAPVGRRAAEALGLKVVLLERPGTGWSTDHSHPDIAAWADDVAHAADHFGADRFAVVGLSGGGPYSLACGAMLPERVACVAVLGGVVPTVGPDACATGVVPLAKRFNKVLELSRWPMGTVLWAAIQPVQLLAHPAYLAYTRTTPPGDRAVFADPEIEAMFMDDLLLASQDQFRAVVNDAILFGRDWGFRLRDVDVPVRWWHGDSDSIVPFEGAAKAAARIPDCELYLRPGESHLGGFAVADEVLGTVARYLDD